MVWLQPFLAKCFAGLHQLHITEEAGHSPEIVAMISLQGERVPFVKPLRVSHAPEYTGSQLRK